MSDLSGGIMQKDNKRLFDKLIVKAGGIIPLPTTITKLIKATSNPYVTSREMGQIIQMDQAMASKILRLANSVSYGFTQRIKTISHAIVCLGFNKVKSLAFTVSSQQMLNNALKRYGMSEGALFQHSLAVAIGCSVIAKMTGLKEPEELYLMGLLHDIGKLVMDQFAEVKMDVIWERYNEGEIKFFKAERDVLEFDHADVGAEISRKWNFPNELSNAIAYHHTPQNTPGDKVNTMIVHVANGVSKTLEVGGGMSANQNLKTEMEGIFKDKNLEILNLKSDHILEIREQVAREMSDLMNEMRD